MKGIVFREFLDMVDMTISPHMTEQLISECNLPSGGAYTAVGTYSHHEIITLVGLLSQKTGKSPSDLVHAFGMHLFCRFVQKYPHFFEGKTDAFDFLEMIDQHIHIEVCKIYPDAQLPQITCSRKSEQEMHLLYQSGRSMADLAHGLIQACIEHFGKKISVIRHDLSSDAEQCVRFELLRGS